jgi:ABC-type spermidine/putrescine transport system permease subunit II
MVAWVMVRYAFPLKRLFDALVDLPFALPTAVAGLVYSSLYVPSGWLGQYLVPLGIEGAYSRLGIVLVLIFTTGHRGTNRIIENRRGLPRRRRTCAGRGSTSRTPCAICSSARSR